MRVIRVTVDRRAEGIQVELAMSPSVLDEVVESSYDRGSVRFTVDEDMALELDIPDCRRLEPDEEPEDQIARVEFERRSRGLHTDRRRGVSRMRQDRQ